MCWGGPTEAGLPHASFLAFPARNHMRVVYYTVCRSAYTEYLSGLCGTAHSAFCALHLSPHCANHMPVPPVFVPLRSDCEDALESAVRSHVVARQQFALPHQAVFVGRILSGIENFGLSTLRLPLIRLALFATRPRFPPRLVPSSTRLGRPPALRRRPPRGTARIFLQHFSTTIN